MSESLSVLKNNFFNKAIQPETLFLLSPKNALEFIEMGVNLGLTLTGVEGFVVTPGGAFQPYQDFSNDVFDWPKDKSEFIEATKKLVASGFGGDIFFQVVFDENSGA